MKEPFPELLAELRFLCWEDWPQAIPEQLAELQGALQVVQQQLVDDLGPLIRSQLPRWKRPLTVTRTDLLEGLEQSDRAILDIQTHLEIVRWR